MTRPKGTQDLRDEIAEQYGESPPTDDEPTGHVPETPDAGMLQALRNGDETTVLEIRRENDWPKETINDILRPLVQEHDSRLAACEAADGAWQNVVPIDHEIAVVEKIVPTSLEEAKSIPLKLKELRDAVRLEIQRAQAGREAAGAIMAIRLYAPGIFAGEPTVPCCPFVESKESTSEEKLRLGGCGSPALNLPDVITAKLREMGIGNKPDDWKGWRLPQAVQPRKHYRLTAGGATR